MSFGFKQVLKGINLEVYPGQIIGYIVSNGAGKSTTIKIMLGLLDGYTGNIIIFGSEVFHGNMEYKKRIGYVPEGVEIYDTLTAREYLMLVTLNVSYLFQMSLVFGITMFMVMTSLISDFSSVLLDIRDKNLILSKPVNNIMLNMEKTYILLFIYF